MCYPDDKAVVKQVKKEVKRISAKTVFIATDDRDLISKFSKEMKKVGAVHFVIGFTSPECGSSLLASSEVGR